MTIAFIVLVELGAIALLVFLFALGMRSSDRSLGDVSEWISVAQFLAVYVLARSIGAYVVALLFARSAGDGFATAMSVASGMLAAGYVFQRHALELTYAPMAVGAALLAYLSTYFVALRHLPASARNESTPANAQQRERERPAMPAAASKAQAARPQRRPLPVHNAAVAGMFVSTFCFTALALLKVYDRASLLGDPLTLFQWAGLSLLVAFAMAELTRGRNVVSWLTAAGAMGLLLVDLLRHGNLVLQRSQSPGTLIENLSSGACALTDSQTLACELTLFTVDHTAAIVSALSLGLALILALRTAGALLSTRRR